MTRAKESRRRRSRGISSSGEYRHPDLEEGEIYRPYIPEYVDDDHFDENVDDGAYQLSRTEIISQFHALKEDERIDVFESFAEKQQAYRKFNFEQVKNRRRIIPLPKVGEEWNKAEGTSHSENLN